MNRNDAAQRQVLLKILRERLREDKRSDSEIARWARISQPTVSRLRGATVQRARWSQPFSKLCSMYALTVAHEADGAADYNTLLGAAVAAAWDGTAETGKNLLALMEALNRLLNRAPGREGGSDGRN